MTTGEAAETTSIKYCIMSPEKGISKAECPAWNIAPMDRSKKQSKDPLNFLLKHVPEGLLDLRLHCPNCQTVFAPNWLETKAGPIVPIKPKYLKYRIPYNGPGRWVPSSTMVRCPQCNQEQFLNLPTKRVLTKGLMFGDEAYRADGAHFVYTYSLIGADHKLIPGIEDGVKTLKSDICPSRAPDRSFT